jgi:hypothetical protein
VIKPDTNQCKTTSGRNEHNRINRLRGVTTCHLGQDLAWCKNEVENPPRQTSSINAKEAGE